MHRICKKFSEVKKMLLIQEEWYPSAKLKIFQTEYSERVSFPTVLTKRERENPLNHVAQSIYLATTYTG